VEKQDLGPSVLLQSKQEAEENERNVGENRRHSRMLYCFLSALQQNRAQSTGFFICFMENKYLFPHAFDEFSNQT